MLRTVPLYIRTFDILSALEAVARTLYTWQERVDQRHHLGSLNDRLLRDIGLDRMAVDSEVGKPFWRA